MRIDDTRKTATGRQFVPSPGLTSATRASRALSSVRVTATGSRIAIPESLPPRREPFRGLVRWIATIAVGIVAINVLLNHGLLFGARLLGQAPGPFESQTRVVSLDALASSILASMSLDEKIGQLIIPMTNDTSMNADVQTMIEQYHIGGYFVRSNGLNRDQLRSYVQQMQDASRIPMIMSTDFEGDGGWNELESALGDLPSESKLAATGDPHQAYIKGQEDAQLLASVGVNVNYAPVVDVLTNPANTVLKRRTFGSDPQTVITFATAYLDGLTSGGVAGCLKHFPGLGSTDVDPHKALPTLDASFEEMQIRELAPYYALLKTNHAPMIMTTHILIPALDPNLPTSVSPLVINGLLRQKMGYDGVVVSDALFMGGLAPRTIPEAGLDAFEAGTDMLLGAGSATDVAATAQLLKDTLAQGKITQQQIDTSVMRILRFKIQWKIIPDTFKPGKFALLEPAGVGMDATADVRRMWGE